VILQWENAETSRIAGHRRMRLVIPLRGAATPNGEASATVSLCDLSLLSIRSPVIDPATLRTRIEPVPIAAAGIENGRLFVLADGPIARGAILKITSNALAVSGSASSTAEIELDGVSPAEATFWFKALEPGAEGRNLLGLASYPGSAPLVPGKVQSSSQGDVQQTLRDHLQRLSAKGFLDRRRADRSIDLFQRVMSGHEPAIAQVFRGADGTIEARLLAATIANTGTVLDGAVETILRSGIDGGRKIRVAFQRTGASKGAASGFTAHVRVGQSIAIVVDDEARKMPLPFLAALIGHEALHRDVVVGLPEELIASMAQFVALAQHVLADPSLVRWGTDAVRSGNVRLVALINSGAAGYPLPGLRAAPLVQYEQNVFPGSRTDWQSLADLLRRRAYHASKGVTSPGSPLLDDVVSRMTGRHRKGVQFTDTTIDLIERSSVLTWEQWVELAHILGLGLPSGRSSPQLHSTSISSLP
jgi:hypothetical protein